MNCPSHSAYPYSPGTKKGSPETAFEAGAIAKQSAVTIRERVLEFVIQQEERGATCDEVALGLGLDFIHYSRPRLSELLAQSQIVNSGRRRRGLSFHSQTVWVHVRFAPSGNRLEQLSFMDLLGAA